MPRRRREKPESVGCDGSRTTTKTHLIIPRPGTIEDHQQFHDTYSSGDYFTCGCIACRPYLWCVECVREGRDIILRAEASCSGVQPQLCRIHQPPQSVEPAGAVIARLARESGYHFPPGLLTKKSEISSNLGWTSAGDQLASVAQTKPKRRRMDPTKPASRGANHPVS
jgi:hypothetical protein